jgi:hypothetical protein
MSSRGYMDSSVPDPSDANGPVLGASLSRRYALPLGVDTERTGGSGSSVFAVVDRSYTAR